MKIRKWKRRSDHSVPGLNTSSTADISFMLLIFFLVTTSMDSDKGLTRQMPPVEPQTEQQTVMDVDRSKVLEIGIDGENVVSVDDNATADLRKEVEDFIMRTGKDHIISISSDENADYDTYFHVTNEIVAAYNELREGEAQKCFKKHYADCTPQQQEQIRELFPQRISEDYED